MNSQSCDSIATILDKTEKNSKALPMQSQMIVLAAVVKTRARVQDKHSTLLSLGTRGLRLIPFIILDGATPTNNAVASIPSGYTNTNMVPILFIQVLMTAR